LYSHTENVHSHKVKSQGLVDP